ncbi:MAG: cheA 2 [Desulfomicrobiaceae bacterium]|jgi:two-component system chemotaxis sensor kinase CheA|nr:cheA 2 [Desulfomicrobiaceae bacterium]
MAAPMDDVFGDFIVEAREHLEAIEPALLELERDPQNRALLDAIFRPMHSLKGASGFLGLTRMNQLAHKGENVLDALRKGECRLRPETMDLILKTTDALRAMLDALETTGAEGDLDIAPIMAELDRVLAQNCFCGAPPPTPTAQSYNLAIVNEEHLGDFLEEAAEITGNLSRGLVELEANPENTERIHDLFRAFHNLKGNAGIIGYVEMNALAHEAETLLGRARKGECAVSRPMIDALLAAVDALESLIAAIEPTGRVTAPDITPALTAVRALTGNAPTTCPDSTTPAPQAAPAAHDAEDLEVFEGTVRQQLATIFAALEGLRTDATQRELVDAIYRSLTSLHNACAYMDLEELRVYAQRTVQLVGKARDEGIDFSVMLDLLAQEAGILENMVESALANLKAPCAAGHAPQPATPAAPAAVHETPKPASAVEPQKPAPTPSPAAPAAERRGTSTIRVEHAKLDHLMNLIGELIINRNRFAMLARDLAAGGDPHEVAQHLQETTDAMTRISDDLQDTIMHVRMLPVHTVFSKFPRLIRDLSRKSGKQVELITEGEETELDKSVVEVIGDPLVHILRNAVDHGLEPPEERRRQGKPETGRVWVRAAHKGNAVVIEVEDDGRGIDPDIMRQKGVEKGLITPEQARNMDDAAARELIFAPGFSTAAQVTDISGRGVGMDVVRTNIKELKGSVQVTSEVGKGTRFTLSLPLTLAIIDALLVRVSGHIFAIPLDAVSETTKIPKESISRVNRRDAVTLRGEVVALVHLADILGLPTAPRPDKTLPTVLIAVQDRRLGLVVDELLLRQDVVIKALGDYLGDIPGISGATILGDGRVILILDPHEIFRMAMRQA